MDQPNTQDERIAAIASLDQPLRMQLYKLLADEGGWVTRDEAADHLGAPRSVAAFHLDKLADAGVVEVTFERTSGRTGPGAGRPSKVYRLALDELSASMPDRHYDLAGRLLADAVAESATNGTPVDECLQRTARATGRAMGVEARTGATGDDEPGLATVVETLNRSGYESELHDNGEIALSNCPFHRLAEEHRALVCGMNLDFISGVVEGLNPAPELQAHLDPQPGSCCVRLRQR